jgi:hypothetical protein
MRARSAAAGSSRGSKRAPTHLGPWVASSMASCRLAACSPGFQRLSVINVHASELCHATRSKAQPANQETRPATAAQVQRAQSADNNKFSKSRKLKTHNFPHNFGAKVMIIVVEKSLLTRQAYRLGSSIHWTEPNSHLRSQCARHCTLGH